MYKLLLRIVQIQTHMMVIIKFIIIILSSSSSFLVQKKEVFDKKCSKIIQLVG